jgi:hypothetical protein
MVRKTTAGPARLEAQAVAARVEGAMTMGGTAKERRMRQGDRAAPPRRRPTGAQGAALVCLLATFAAPAGALAATADVAPRGPHIIHKARLRCSATATHTRAGGSLVVRCTLSTAHGRPRWHFEAVLGSHAASAKTATSAARTLTTRIALPPTLAAGRYALTITVPAARLKVNLTITL